jgi:fibronectin type 3 domain-containing protein
MAFAKMIDTQAPLAPSIERLYQNDSVIYMRWNRSEADDLAKYNIYRSKADTNSFELIAEEKDIFANLEYDVSGDYYFKMTVEDLSGNESPFSATRKLIVKINEIPTPKDGSLDTNKRSIELNWEIENTDEISGFFIQRKDIKSGNVADLAYLKANELSFTDWNVEFDAEYEYYIFAHNEKWIMSRPLLIKYKE